MKSAETGKPIAEESFNPKQSIVRSNIDRETIITELKRSLPLVERAIARLEEAKKVDRALLEREITI